MCVCLVDKERGRERWANIDETGVDIIASFFTYIGFELNSRVVVYNHERGEGGGEGDGNVRKR